MAYNDAIETVEQPSEPLRTETKTQSLYACIRYASKFMKIRTQIRKHRTLPNDVPVTSISTIYDLKEKCSFTYEDNEKVNEETIEFDINEKQHLMSLPPPPRASSWSTNNKQYHHRSQIPVTPSTKVAFILPESTVQEEDEETILGNEENYREEQENILTHDDGTYDDEEYDVEDLLDTDYILNDTNCSSSYMLTLQKLSGNPTIVSQKSKTTNTAVLITLSSSSLAAANAAIQKRQRIRNPS
ncbi:MAG: hypothetical protein EXX96DRAFT_579960 [Benjaminiella poitrasii]|nr:MAG: hypothetical protein EXX96DRAFT_579960 [Benjaminiella poitrasii]